jgi:hypothetical protein
MVELNVDIIISPPKPKGIRNISHPLTLRGLAAKMPNGTFQLPPFIPFHPLMINLVELIFRPCPPPIVLHDSIPLWLTIGIIRITTIMRMTRVPRTKDGDVWRGRHGWSWWSHGQARETGVDDIGNRRRRRWVSLASLCLARLPE